MKKIKICGSSNNSYISAIMNYFGVSKEAATIVYTWYDAEDAIYEFGDNIQGFCEYLEEDLQDMLEAASDPEEAEIVSKEFDLWSPFQEDEEDY